MPRFRRIFASGTGHIEHLRGCHPNIPAVAARYFYLSFFPSFLRIQHIALHNNTSVIQTYKVIRTIRITAKLLLLLRNT